MIIFSFLVNGGCSMPSAFCHVKGGDVLPWRGCDIWVTRPKNLASPEENRGVLLIETLEQQRQGIALGGGEGGGE